MASSNNDEGFVWLLFIGLALWVAYDKWWKDDDAPKAPVYQPALRPTGMVKLGTNDDGTVRWLDNDSVAGARDRRRGWIISYHDKDKTISHRETRQMVRANCEDGSYTIPSYVTYDKNQKVILSWDESEEDKARVYHPAPGTIGGDNFKAVCDPKFDPPIKIQPPATNP